jgi:tetratricopeptide (TPR) repeat protein
MSPRLGAAPAVRAYRAVVRGTGVKMKQDRRSPSVSDKTFSWVMRLGVMVLAIGVAGFGFMYYQDQHVDAGPSMVDRQTQTAEAAVKKAPNNIGARLELAGAYQADKRMDDALAQYKVILKADKQNRTALLGSGRVLIAKGDFKAATAAYKRITGASKSGEFAGADPQLEEAYYFLGSIAVTQGNNKLALTDLQAALKIEPTDSDALYLVGVVKLKDGAPQLAVDAFKQALQFVPTGWCQPWSQLALAQGKLGRAPEATYAGAMADFCNKKSVEAQTRLKTLTKGPLAVDSLLGLGLIAETESNNAEAATWYKQVITIDAKNATAISALSRLGAGPTSSSTK